MERSSYGFYTKRSEILDNLQKKKDHDKDSAQNQNFKQKSTYKPTTDVVNSNSPVNQHVPTQQLLSPPHNSAQPVQGKDESKDEILKVANSTTITLIENSNYTCDKDKDNYPKNYFTLEPKNDKKDDANKNSITITRTLPKQSPGNNQADKTKGQPKPIKRPLQCLETLAEKAGITFEDKYEAANTLLALDKQNNSFSRSYELIQPKSEPENINQTEDYRNRTQKEEDDKLQIQQQIIQQQQQQQQFQQLQQQQLQLQQQQIQQLQHQALQTQHQQALQQHIKNQQDQQELPVHTQQLNISGIRETNLSFLASPQNQKHGMSGDIKQPQIVEEQTQMQQMTMSQHDSQQQHHQTVTVVSSMPSSMAAHQVQQQQQNASIQQQAGGGISTMPPLQNLPPPSSLNTQHPQQISDWGQSRVQVIQQPLQNNTYLQQLYNAQGPLLMPGNIALHPGINSQQIQVIAAGKPFQGNQLAPHMLTAQGKQVLQGQAAPFPGYTTIPTIPTTQNQTFVFSPLGVINSQPSILPAHSQPTVSGIGQQQKQNEMHKVMSGAKVSGTKVGTTNTGGTQTVPVQAQCVQVSQPVLSAQQPQAQIISPLQAGGQTMQFAPWQISGALPQVWAGGLQAGTIPSGGLLAPNPIFIRGTQPDAPSMFIQHSPQNVQHANASVTCATGTTTKPRASSDGMTKASRPVSILPTGIRPASSVSTQTNANQPQNQAKQRNKPNIRSPAPAAKQDAANQTNKLQHQIQQPKQQLLVMNSSGQMAQISSVTDKQIINKSHLQQQAMLQHQAIQQQQQQQQQQTQQMVQHYQQQGLTLGMQQAGMPVGSVAQTLPMAGIPQTISMVQQIHPLGAMGQPGTLVGQINSTHQQQNASMTHVQALQQPKQSLGGGGLVQTSVSMTVQQQANMVHSVAMQTVSANNINTPQLTLQAPQGTVGLIAAPVQGSVMSMQPPATVMAHVKNEDDEGQQIAMQQATVVQPIAPQVITSTEVLATETTPVFSSSPTPPIAAATADLSVSTIVATVGSVAPTDSNKPSQAKVEIATSTDASTPVSATMPPPAPVPSSAQQKTPVALQVVTTVASSSSSTMTTAITAPVTSGAGTVNLFKTTQSTPRHMSQQTDKGLPKAMVKPNILTHVIEGYVIQEAGEPFAVNRPLREWSVAADKEQDKENKLPSDEPPRKKLMLDSTASVARISSSNDSANDSQNNAKADHSSGDVTMTDLESQTKTPNANKWTVAEVCDFIRNIPGCAGYADEFLMQEVDGEALLLIKPEHLVMALSMKLGPALKIVACIDSLRPGSETSHDHA